MQRIDANDGLKIVQDLVRDDHRGFQFAAVRDTVADGIDLIDTGNDAQFGICQKFKNQGNGIVVIFQFNVFVVICLARTFVCDGTADADLFAKAFGDNGVFVHVEQLIFQ